MTKSPVPLRDGAGVSLKAYDLNSGFSVNVRNHFPTKAGTDSLEQHSQMG